MQVGWRVEVRNAVSHECPKCLQLFKVPWLSFCSYFLVVLQRLLFFTLVVLTNVSTSTHTFLHDYAHQRGYLPRSSVLVHPRSY